jgi:hypothetical protein
VLLRAIMKYRRQELDSSAAVAGDSSTGLSRADDHLELCAALHYRNTTDGAYSEPNTVGGASITGLSPRAFIIDSNLDAKPSASSEAVTASLGWTNGNAASAARILRGHWLASVAIDCAEKVQRRGIGRDFDFVRPWLQPVQHFVDRSFHNFPIFLLWREWRVWKVWSVWRVT